MRRQRPESGAVTAEAALGVGLLSLVALGLAWMVCLGVVAVRAQDAAREAVRALARGDSPQMAVGLAQEVAPQGSTVVTSTDGRLARVSVRSPVRGPGGFFGFVGTLMVTAQAVGLVEDSG